MRHWMIGLGLVTLVGCGGDSGGDGTAGDTNTTVDTNDTSASGSTGETSDSDTSDTGDTNAECVDGDTRPCYPGPEGTEDVGVCVAGTELCEGGQWLDCDGATVPATDELCDDLDDDCDGVVDDACISWHQQYDVDSGLWDLAFDDAGNVYVCGVYWNNFVLGGVELPAHGDWDVFVARFTPDGTHVWSQGMGADGEDECGGIALDGAGNLYVTGSMAGDTEFDGNTIIGLGSDDLFVAKLSVDGQAQWGRLYGSTGREIGNDVAVDAAGGPVIAGSFDDETDLGDGPVVAAGADDVFLLRLTPDGDPMWSRTAGSTDSTNDRGWAVGVFPGSGDILFGGAFNDTVNLGGDDLVAVWTLDMFLARYTADGTHVWSMAEGSGAEDDIYSIDIDANGEVFVAGRGGSEVDFGGTPLGGDGPAVVAKLDGDGAPIWVRHSQGSVALATAVAAGPSGGAFVAGYFDGSFDFGDGPDTQLGGAGIETYIARFDADGSHVWSRAFGEADSDYAWAVAAGAEGQSIYGGSLKWFEGRMFMTMFGPGG